MWLGGHPQDRGFISLASMHPLEFNTWTSLMSVEPDLQEGLSPTKALVLLERKEKRMLHLCQGSYNGNMLLLLIVDLPEHKAGF